ncbi:hypothetical protein AR158_c225L [Paramecium bursaria Chlorella virus AR158]|uniref:hypothetical protein n=1 Tax=Paramecium bursaria Chlorella virus AR158 TaxID=380598 RepID=UPI00015AA87B|nr:hypothetical protein AR158_c225L [Paramecium bursaria Chlorella virus AR158]ABU43771.1 hypothetical protein AR158_c225L [Paramecium bursaria Chlorella virus AR158]
MYFQTLLLRIVQDIEAFFRQSCLHYRQCIVYFQIGILLLQNHERLVSPSYAFFVGCSASFYVHIDVSRIVHLYDALVCSDEFIDILDFDR